MKKAVKLRKAAEIKIIGIKCDNPECDYKDKTVTIDKYEQYLNVPCPKCSRSLLTEDDYMRITIIMKITKVLNVVFFPWMLLQKLMGKRPKIQKMKIKMDGHSEPKFIKS